MADWDYNRWYEAALHHLATDDEIPAAMQMYAVKRKELSGKSWYELYLEHAGSEEVKRAKNRGRLHTMEQGREAADHDYTIVGKLEDMEVDADEMMR